ncbi:major capsid protein [Brevibacillus reuszeri]|uniref:major capsid protein n=1 Tax=Brevibacillus reuszeri TaxID=54915 RepID=UPI002898877A|nr:major capsid protein [Brevibacillus reuszeri]
MARDIYSFPYLFRVVEAFPKPSTYILDQFFAEGEIFEKEEIEIQTKKGHKPIAPYVNELLPGKVILRTGFTAEQYKPALVKPMRVITTNDLKVRQAGENLFNPDSPEVRAQKLLTKDLVELNDSIVQRMVEMGSSLMFTGKVTQVGEGISQELDYDLENVYTLSGTDLFSNDAAKVLEILAGIKRDVMQKSNRTPRKILTTFEVGQTIMSHPKLVDIAKINNNSVISAGNLNQEMLPDGVTYHGYLQQVDLHVYSLIASYTNDDGVETDVVPAGTLAMLPDGKPFEFAYGANLIMGDNGAFQYVKARITPQSWTTKEPAARYLQMLTRPFPIPVDVNGWAVAKVL